MAHRQSLFRRPTDQGESGHGNAFSPGAVSAEGLLPILEPDEAPKDLVSPPARPGLHHVFFMGIVPISASGVGHPERCFPPGARDKK